MLDARLQRLIDLPESEREQFRFDCAESFPLFLAHWPGWDEKRKNFFTPDLFRMPYLARKAVSYPHLKPKQHWVELKGRQLGDSELSFLPHAVWRANFHGWAMPYILQDEDTAKAFNSIKLDRPMTFFREHGLEWLVDGRLAGKVWEFPRLGEGKLLLYHCAGFPGTGLTYPVVTCDEASKYFKPYPGAPGDFAKTRDLIEKEIMPTLSGGGSLLLFGTPEEDSYLNQVYDQAVSRVKDYPLPVPYWDPTMPESMPKDPFLDWWDRKVGYRPALGGNTRELPQGGNYVPFRIHCSMDTEKYNNRVWALGEFNGDPSIWGSQHWLIAQTTGRKMFGDTLLRGAFHPDLLTQLREGRPVGDSNLFTRGGYFGVGLDGTTGAEDLGAIDVIERVPGGRRIQVYTWAEQTEALGQALELVRLWRLAKAAGATIKILPEMEHGGAAVVVLCIAIEPAMFHDLIAFDMPDGKATTAGKNPGFGYGASRGAKEALYGAALAALESGVDVLTQEITVQHLSRIRRDANGKIGAGKKIRDDAADAHVLALWATEWRGSVIVPTKQQVRALGQTPMQRQIADIRASMGDQPTQAQRDRLRSYQR